MEAVAWSLFGLMAVSVGTLATAYWRLAARIEEVREELGGRMDRGHAELGSRIDAQTARIDAQTVRIDALNARMDAHVHPHAG